MKYFLVVLVFLLLGCGNSDQIEGPEFKITEILYDGDDIARASFDQNTKEYLLFFHRKDAAGSNINEGPFIYKVMNDKFQEVRTGMFGSKDNSTNALWYDIQFLSMPDTILNGANKVLSNGKIMRVWYKTVDILDEQYNVVNSIHLPSPFSDYTETDDLIAFTFDHLVRPSEETIMCLTYNKNNGETKSYFYQLDSQNGEPDTSDSKFYITHDREQRLIVRTPTGVYTLVGEKWTKILTDYIYKGRSPIIYFVDSKNRLYTEFNFNAEVYDLNTERLVTTFNAPSFVGEHPDGDIICFRHPFFSGSNSHRLYKFKIF